MEKICNKCRESKPLTAYYRNKYTRDGFNNRCKDCEKKNYKSTPTLKQQKKESRWRIKYGITVDEYNKLFLKQKGVCAVCGKPETIVCGGTLRTLSVDHNHKTGKVRGLLCASCNTALGYVKDDKEHLLELALYLEKSEVTPGGKTKRTKGR